MSTQPMLLGPPVTGTVGDQLERFYTPDKLARMCLDRLPNLPRSSFVLEPSCGGGSFVRAARSRWSSPMLIAMDVDPDVPGFDGAVDRGRGEDFLTSTVGAVNAVVGNPPFGPALDHVRKALEWAPLVGFILPLSRIEGTKGWGAFLDAHPPQAVYPIAGRPWPDVVRGCGFWVWTREPGSFHIGKRITDWR